MNLDQLDQNPTWQYYKESYADAELTSISRLPKAFSYPPPQWKPKSNSSPDSGRPHARLERPASALNVALAISKPRFVHEIAAQLPPTHTPNTPGPPTGLTGPTGLTAAVMAPLPELNEIVVLTQQLNDSRILANASSYSNYYLFSIGRWIQEERMLVWQDELQHRCPVKPIDLPATNGSRPDPNVLADCLTIQDWKKLAAYEMPSAGTADENQIGEGIGKAVDISIGALPHRGDLASFIAAAALVVTLLYFGAFLREAVHSEHFPAAATLFSAFSRTPWANRAIFLLLFFPLLSAVTLAIVSKSWLLYCESAVIGIITFWILVGFHEKSYFKTALSLSRAGRER